MFFMLIFCLAELQLAAQEIADTTTFETYTLSGRINVEKPSGRIYVFLFDQESFEQEPGIDTVSFWVDNNKTQVEYEFSDIPPGVYALKSYQDVNGNHKLDRWLFAPREPWAYSYKEAMKFPPKFTDVSFQLYFDLRINLTLGN